MLKENSNAYISPPPFPNQLQARNISVLAISIHLH